MDSQVKAHIELRAREIFKLAENQLLNFDSTDRVNGTAFRYAFLVLRRPRAFLAAFCEGEIMINPNEVEEFIWHCQDHISGEAGLLREEQELIANHNREAAALRDNRRILPTELGSAHSKQMRF